MMLPLERRRKKTTTETAQRKGEPKKTMRTEGWTAAALKLAAEERERRDTGVSDGMENGAGNRLS